MAKLVTITVLVNTDDDSEIFEGLTDMLCLAKAPVDEDEPDEPAWLVDWKMTEPAPADGTVNEALANDTYEVGSLAR